MSRISTYPIDAVVDTADLLIGTDSEDSNKTKNYTIASIISLAEASIDLAEVLAVGNTATNDINLTGIVTATTVNSTNGTIGVFSSTTGTIVTLGSTTGNITTVNSTNIVNSALVSTANLTASAGITNNLLYIDSIGSSGSVNDVLLSTGTATQWGSQTLATWDLDAGSGGPLTISDSDSVEFYGGTYVTTAITTPISPEQKVLSISHDSTSRTDTTSAVTLTHGGTFTSITSSTTNATGHVTAANVATYTLPADAGTNWDLAADTGSTLTISDSSIVNFDGGTDIQTSVNFVTDNILSIAHSDVSRADTTSAVTLTDGGTFTAITSATTSATGHVTAANVATYTMPAARGYIGARANMAGQTTSMPIITNWYALNYNLSYTTASLWSTQPGAATYQNRIRYDGTPDQLFNITVTFTINGWTVGDIAEFSLYNSDVIITNSEQKIEATSSLYTTGTLQSMQLMSTGDYIEVFAKAPTATTIVAVDFLTISAVPV